jgi:hypothetical protein
MLGSFGQAKVEEGRARLLWSGVRRGPMPALRFNHMELTMAPGALDEKARDEIKAFYGDVFAFEALEVPLFGKTALLLRTDPETSQFLLLMEQEIHIESRGYDHLGFLYDSRAEVDEKLARVKSWQQRDDRVQIKEYEDLVVGDVTTHAFYFRYRLPIWFDVQVIETAEAPAHGWSYA